MTFLVFFLNAINIFLNPNLNSSNFLIKFVQQMYKLLFLYAQALTKSLYIFKKKLINNILQR